MTQSKTQKALKFIAACDDAASLRQLAINAARLANEEVRIAAKLRLYSILPNEKPGTLEYDVWQSIYALEDILSDERGKTTRLARTRQKIVRDGEKKTVCDLVLGKPTQGFELLMARNMRDLTFEALVLKHSDEFTDETVNAATDRLRC
jgi:hypothetical protein